MDLQIKQIPQIMKTVCACIKLIHNQMKSIPEYLPLFIYESGF